MLKKDCLNCNKLKVIKSQAPCSPTACQCGQAFKKPVPAWSDVSDWGVRVFVMADDRAVRTMGCDLRSFSNARPFKHLAAILLLTCRCRCRVTQPPSRSHGAGSCQLWVRWVVGFPADILSPDWTERCWRRRGWAEREREREQQSSPLSVSLLTLRCAREEYSARFCESAGWWERTGEGSWWPLGLLSFSGFVCAQ